MSSVDVMTPRGSRVISTLAYRALPELWDATVESVLFATSSSHIANVETPNGRILVVFEFREVQLKNRNGIANPLENCLTSDGSP